METIEQKPVKEPGWEETSHPGRAIDQFPELDLEKTIVRPLKVKKSQLPAESDQADQPAGNRIPLKKIITGLGAAVVIIGLFLVFFWLGSQKPLP